MEGEASLDDLAPKNISSYETFSRAQNMQSKKELLAP